MPANDYRERHSTKLEMAHVLFMDIVGYSKLPMDHQEAVLRTLQVVVSATPQFLQAPASQEMIRLPTGDGMALVFFGDAEAAARCALEVSRALKSHQEILLRMGLHSGPVYRVADINANQNVAGGGINVAQRVMDCGDAGHILASQSVADVLGQLSSWKDCLHDLGEAEVKHGVRVHLYNLYTDEVGNAKLPQKLHKAQKTAASEMRADRNRLRRDTDSGRISSSGSGAPQPPAGLARKRYVVLAACVALLAAAFAAYHFWPRSNSLSGPAKITQISQWNKPMSYESLSPDGHAVAFVSPVGGIEQVFLMLTSGGEPLQLTNDEGDKVVNTFSPDGKEIYYGRSLGREEVWAVPTLGGAPRRVVPSARYVVPSLDGASVFYVKVGSSGIFRAGKSGINEELVYKSEGTGQVFFPLLVFPGGNDLLAFGFRWNSPNFHFYKINLTSHEAVDFGEVSENHDIAWAEPGNTIMFSRTINGLTNIWKYSLQDRGLTQITFGTGPDFSPMPDPGGKGIYYVNGKSFRSLTAYHVQSKESTDIVSEDATQPAISPNGKRVMYITLPAPKRNELWVSGIDGGNKVKIATGESLHTGAWAPDNFHLSFFEKGGERLNALIVGADGSGLRQLPSTGGTPYASVWSPDQKSIYMSIREQAELRFNIWKWSVDSSTPEKFVDNCGLVSDIDPSGEYLVEVVDRGEMTGIYEVSTSDRKCIPLLPGAVTVNATFAPDGKSLLYAVASRGEVTIYRQPWREGKIIGAPQVALKVPFAFPLKYAEGIAYDFSRDLSTIVYARPGGHADLYLLSQK